MSDKTHPNQFQLDLETDHEPSILHNRQEENIGEQLAFVTILYERLTERHEVTDEGTLVNGSLYHQDIPYSQEESSPFGSPRNPKHEAFAISASTTEHRRERIDEARAFPRSSRSYEENAQATLRRDAPATSLTCVAHSRLLQTRMKPDPSQEQNLDVTTTAGGAVVGSIRTRSHPNRCVANVRHPRYTEYRKRLKSFKGHVRSWPHQKPSAEDMAQANFIFRGSDCDHDAVECYLCGNTFRKIQEKDNVDKLCKCNLEQDRDK